MTDLIKYIACSLVDHPEEVEVTANEKEDGSVCMELRVAQSDIGKVIGKQGRIAKALSAVVKAAAAKQGKTVTVEIL
jgi:predicted RNA-binding protein YlqC (UPF0109 family)